MALFSVSKITDHVGRAVSRLVVQFKQALRLRGLVSAVAEQTQKVEDALTDVRLQVRDLNAAQGDALDKIGKLLDAPERGSRTDAQYRARIFATIVVNKSHGDKAQMYEIAKGIVLAWAVDGQPKITEHQPAHFTVAPDLTVTNDPAQAQELAQVLNGSTTSDGAAAAGVRAIVISRSSAVGGGFFRFAGGAGPSAGFGVGAFTGARDK